MHALLLLVAVSLLFADDAFAQDNADDQEARKARLARLGAGKVKHPPPVGDVYTLESLIARSSEVHPLLIAKASRKLYAELRLEEANWGMFPKFEVTSVLSAVPNNVDFNNGASNLEKYIAFDIGPLSNNSLKIIFPVYTFGKLDSAQDLAQLGVDQAELETRKERLKLNSQLREAFYGAQLGKMIKAVMVDGVDVIKDEIARMDEAREFGDEDVDIVQLRELQIYESELDTKAVDTSRLVDLTKAALAVLAQMERDTFDIPNFDENIDPSKLPSLLRCLQLAQDSRPDVLLLQKAVAARNHQVDLATSNFYPDLFVGFDLGYSFSTINSISQEGTATDSSGQEIAINVDPLSDPFNYFRFGLILGARLKLDPANRYWKLQQARAQLAETRSLRDAALEGIDLAVEKRWREASDLLQKIAALERGLKAADRWKLQTGIAYQSGGADLKNFIKPLKAFYKARLLLLQAQYEYRVALVKLSLEIGVDDIEAIAAGLADADLQNAKP